jgi:predicted porin
LAASFWLEAPITNDDGQQGISTFARRSTVSLSGGFGEVRLGRDYSPSFWNDSVFDPFGVIGVGTNLIHTAFNGSTLCGIRAHCYTRRWRHERHGKQFGPQQQQRRLLPACRTSEASMAR